VQKLVQKLWKQIGRRGALLVTLTLAVFCLLAFQVTPQPSPTPLITFAPQTPAPAVDDDRLWDLLDKALPLLLAGGALVVAMGRKQVDKAGVEVEAAKEDVAGKALINRFAEKTLSSSDSAEAAAKSAAEAARIAQGTVETVTVLQGQITNLNTKLGDSDMTIIALQNQNKSQQNQIEDLRRQLLDWKDENETKGLLLLEKDKQMAQKETDWRRTVELRDVDIARLNNQLYNAALQLTPPNFNNTLHQPVINAETVQKVEIQNTTENPVPTIDLQMEQ